MIQLIRFKLFEFFLPPIILNHTTKILSMRRMYNFTLPAKQAGPAEVLDGKISPFASASMKVAA